MSNDYGTCVVLSLEPNDLPDTVEGGQHITLLYFGDEKLDEHHINEIREIIEDCAYYLNGANDILVNGQEFFGPDGDAVVVTVDPSRWSLASKARAYILGELSDELFARFKKDETFLIYNPHMTVGYISEGFDPDTELDLPEKLKIRGISLWNGATQEEFPLPEDDLSHIGTPRHSGRYPWGSGENPYQRNRSFLGMVDDLKKQGLTEAEIANSLGMTSRELRARKSIAKNDVKQEQIAKALEMKARGYSNTAIGEDLGIGESQVRRLLDPAVQAKATKLDSTVDELRKAVESTGYLDFGEGTESHLGVSTEHLKTAVKVLEEQGYSVHYIKTPQLNGSSGEFTTIRVLAPPGTTTHDIYNNLDKVSPIKTSYQDVDGVNHLGLKPIESISSDRLAVRFAEQGGTDRDGLIELRRGVEDIDMGQANYAQVRIGVDGTHYIKGMAVYSDDLPPGVDVRFNTNKSQSDGKIGSLKAMSDDPDNPFGSSVYQKEYISKDGKTKVSALNIVNEEGKWDTWSKTLSSQFLSKQSHQLVETQLKEAQALKKADFDEIMSLTNPVVKRELLLAYADGCDKSAADLKAHMMPRQRNQVIIPVPSMKETEVYAPNFRSGESVVLIRHPHGGRFEIPELTVTHKNKEARSILGDHPKDAIGIHPKVAERLSGADFDGDTVLVIPNNKGLVKTSPALKQLKDFDPKTAYPGYPGMPKMVNKQGEMGRVSNLITDMTIKGAPDHELARAVKHSMVVIDAEKHNLNYKLSAKENGIAELKTKYQGGPTAGASTIISRSKSTKVAEEMIPRKARDGGPIDISTGKKVLVPSGRTYTVRNPRTGEIQSVPYTSRIPKMDLTDDAFSLSSGTRIEAHYARHANEMKSQANRSRREALAIKPPARNPEAAKTYANEVASLNAKLNNSLKNKPLERKAQLVGNSIVKQKRQANPGMDRDDLKKVKRQALSAARQRVGAEKSKIEFTPKEWEAVQANAISPTKLKTILGMADLDEVKKLSMPREAPVMSTAKVARAKAMAANGFSQADIAQVLGVSTSTISSAIR